MKIKKIIAAGLAVAMIFSANMTAFAAQWQHDNVGWWYQEDDGSWPTDGWKWIHGKCYYFNGNGYMLADTTTPDGHTVNGDGAWTVNGAVQIQAYDTDYPLKGMLAELHLETSDPHNFVESAVNGSTTNWAAYNDSIKYMFAERLTFYALRLSGGMDNFSEAGTHGAEMEETYKVIKDFLNSFDWQNANDRTKAEKAAQLVCKSSYVGSGSISTYNPYGCLVKKEAVCDGFAYSFAFLTRLMGMEAFYDPYSGHAMNGVKIDGKWYAFDGSAANANTGGSYSIFAPAEVTVENGLAKINSFNANDTESFGVKIR